MTMQTDAPLARITVQTLNVPMFEIGGWGLRDRLDMDQPYQRGDVWGDTRRRNLIRSFLIGIPVPPIIVNDRFGASFKHPGYDKERNWARAIVDGKQRVTTILRFIDGGFSVPASWWEPNEIESTVDTEDGPYVVFSGLTERGQGRFESCAIGVVMGRERTLDRERLIFDLVNFGGVAQGESDDDLVGSRP